MVKNIDKINTSQIKKKYNELHFFKLSIIFLSLIILIILILFSVNIGTADFSTIDVFKCIIDFFFSFLNMNIDELKINIILFLRMPRIIMAIICGAGLAISGVIMQGITRNPLVSPFTIGLSSSAAFGASLAIIFGFSFAGSGKFFIIANAFLFFLGCAFIVYSLSSIKKLKPETLVLSGIALTYLFSALTATLQFIATEEQLKAVVD